jgi:VanZ family protein
MLQKLFKYLFWSGYVAVLITSLVRIPGNINRVELGVGNIKVHLDQLLHFCVYFLICIYYFAGKWRGLTLFNTNALRKFIIVTVLLASVTEVVQLWIPVRTFNPMDWMANISGVILGLGVGRILNLT